MEIQREDLGPLANRIQRLQHQGEIDAADALRLSTAVAGVLDLSAGVLELPTLGIRLAAGAEPAQLNPRPEPGSPPKSGELQTHELPPYLKLGDQHFSLTWLVREGRILQVELRPRLDEEPDPFIGSEERERERFHIAERWLTALAGRGDVISLDWGVAGTHWDPMAWDGFLARQGMRG